MRALTRLEMMLWGFIGGEETRPELFTMNTANKYRYELMEKCPLAKFCALQVTPKARHYEVILALLDENLDPIKYGDGTCVGRQFSAERIGEDVVKFLDGKPYRLFE